MKPGDKGMPRKDCPSRVLKIVMRKPHWREILFVILDMEGRETDRYYVPEPVIRCKRKGDARV